MGLQGPIQHSGKGLVRESRPDQIPKLLVARHALFSTRERDLAAWVAEPVQEMQGVKRAAIGHGAGPAARPARNQSGRPRRLWWAAASARRASMNLFQDAACSSGSGSSTAATAPIRAPICAASRSRSGRDSSLQTVSRDTPGQAAEHEPGPAVLCAGRDQLGDGDGKVRPLESPEGAQLGLDLVGVAGLDELDHCVVADSGDQRAPRRVRHESGHADARLACDALGHRLPAVGMLLEVGCRGKHAERLPSLDP